MPKYTEKQLRDAVKYALEAPDVPTLRIAELFGVDRTTLRRRVLGTHQDRASAHRNQQLLTVGEERAIGDYIGMMADVGFPLNHDLLRQIVQDIINSRRKDNSHVVGLNWVTRFLNRNPEFNKKYVRYQERARVAVSNDIELQDGFLRKLSNFTRRKDIKAENIWNCDEKGRDLIFLPYIANLILVLGIIMGKNTTRVMAIVRTGGPATAIMEGSREFASVLETVSASGVVIPPFIIWQGKTHRESYYKEGGVEYEATFAVSPSGYIDDELGYEYMKVHFEPHTRGTATVPPPHCLIVDGHSSHIAWKVVKYALDHNIHMICLPSKSTHLLQPLDVGCFGVLQTTYEKNLRGK